MSMKIFPLPEWADIAEEISRTGGVTMVIGNVDSGKSTLARHLARRLAESAAVGVVDADVGQSSLCIPGTVAAALFRTREDAEAYRCDRFAFVGTASPVHAVKPIIDATAYFVEALRKEAAGVVVDTGGLVAGYVGKGLKLAKIRRLQPDRIIAIQREDECEEILRCLDEVLVYRLSPSPHVSTRNREARARYRLMKMRRFMEDQELWEHLLPERVDIRRVGPAGGRNVAIPPGTLVGLNDGNITRDIGVVEEGGEPFLIKCHLRSLKDINRVIIGDLSMSEQT